MRETQPQPDWSLGLHSLIPCCFINPFSFPPFFPLPHSLIKKSWTRSTTPLGPASWAGASVVMRHINASSTSTWAKWSFFCSGLVKSRDVPHTQGSIQKQGLQPLVQTPETERKLQLTEHLHRWAFIVSFCTRHSMFHLWGYKTTSKTAYIYIYFLFHTSLPEKCKGVGPRLT